MLMQPIYGHDQLLVAVQFELDTRFGRGLQEHVARYLAEGIDVRSFLG
jgi:hypothetical protein